MPCSNDMIQYHDTAGYYNHHNIVWAVDKYPVAVATNCLFISYIVIKKADTLCINETNCLH